MDSFQTFIKSIFGQDQASSISTHNWHLLDHLVDSLRRVVCIQYFYVRQNKSSHRLFEALYRKTSRKIRSVMSNTIIRQNCQVRLPLSNGILEKQQRENRYKKYVEEYDISMLARHGKGTHTLRREAALKSLTSEERKNNTLARNIPWFPKLGLTLGVDGLRALLRLLIEKFLEKGTVAITAHHKKLLVLSSAHISVITVPALPIR